MGEGSKAGWEGSRRRGSGVRGAGGGVGWRGAVSGKPGLLARPGEGSGRGGGVVTAGLKDSL